MIFVRFTSLVALTLCASFAQAQLAAAQEPSAIMNAILVGHSGGEVTRYIGRHGTKRVVKAVLLGAARSTTVRSTASDTTVWH